MKDEAHRPCLVKTDFPSFHIVQTASAVKNRKCSPPFPQGKPSLSSSKLR